MLITVNTFIIIRIGTGIGTDTNDLQDIKSYNSTRLVCSFVFSSYSIITLTGRNNLLFFGLDRDNKVHNDLI